MKNLVICVVNPETRTLVGTRCLPLEKVNYLEHSIARAVIGILTRAKKPDIQAITDFLKKSQDVVFSDWDDLIDYINDFPEIFYFSNSDIPEFNNNNEKTALVTISYQ